MNIDLNLSVGPNDNPRPAKKRDLQRNIEVLQRVAKSNVAMLDAVNLLDTASILRHIQNQLPE